MSTYPNEKQPEKDASSASGSIAYDTLMMASGIAATLLQVVSQVSVLASVLGGQRDGVLLAVLSFATSMSDWVTKWNAFTTERGEWCLCLAKAHPDV